MRVYVTEDDISRAGYGCFSCPIAMALTQCLKVPFIGSVQSKKIEIIATGPAAMGIIVYKTPLPLEAQEFIKNYDVYQMGNPFSFEVDIPNEYLKEAHVS